MIYEINLENNYKIANADPDSCKGFADSGGRR